MVYFICMFVRCVIERGSVRGIKNRRKDHNEQPALRLNRAGLSEILRLDIFFNVCVILYK